MKNKSTARKRRAAKTKYRINSCRDADRKVLVVFRSSQHIYAQIARQGENGSEVIASASTVDKELALQLKGKNKTEQALMVGSLLAERAMKFGIGKVAFDRSGYKYHGRIKALADGARKVGLNF